MDPQSSGSCERLLETDSLGGGPSLQRPERTYRRQDMTDLLLGTFSIHVPLTGRSVGEFEQYLMCV